MGGFISGLTYGSLSLQPVDLLAPLVGADRASTQPTGTFTSGLSTVWSPAPPPDITTETTGQFSLAGLSPLERQLASLQPLYEHAVRNWKQNAPDVPEAAAMMTNLATAYQTVGKTQEAEKLYNQALQSKEKALGPESPVLSIDLNGLGHVYCATGRCSQAGPLYARALAIDRKAYGEEHLSVGIDLGNLAYSCLSSNKAAEAESLFRQALAVEEKALGPDSPNLVDLYRYLAASVRALRRDKEARQYEKKARKISDKLQRNPQPTS